MYEAFRQIIDSPVAVVMVVALLIAAVVFTVRLESDVRHLQSNVAELRQEMRTNHAEVLRAIDEANADALERLVGHTHDDQGHVQIGLGK
jgi:hypothetical protein